MVGMNNSPERFSVKNGKSLYLVNKSSVIMVERYGRKTFIHLKDKIIETSETLESLEEILFEENYIRSHRSFIININFVLHIEAIGSVYQVHFEGYEKVANISKQKFDFIKKVS